MEELRALVRKWNLHHKRNFWRENPTKDDVVAALNRHIKHVKLVHDNIESKKAERREADKKRQVPSAPGEAFRHSGTVPTLKRVAPLTVTTNACFRREGVIVRELNRLADADLPRDSVESGIIYMSRWGRESTKDDHLTRAEEKDTVERDALEQRSPSPETSETDDNTASVRGRAFMNDATKMQAQQKCCSALMNMTLRDQVR